MHLDFINADLIAAGLAPFNPDTAALRAGRLMLEEIATRIAQGRSFAFETTLSGIAYARQIPVWKRQGYHVKLLFLSLPSVEMAIARVSARVAQGGNSIPEPVIRRRFGAGLRNFDRLYKPLVDAWMHYDNSGPAPVLIDSKDNPNPSSLSLAPSRDPDLLKTGDALQRAARKAPYNRAANRYALLHLARGSCGEYRRRGSRNTRCNELIRHRTRLDRRPLGSCEIGSSKSVPQPY